MAQSWRSIKDAEKFNKGRAALRGDYLRGTYDKCKMADFGPHYRNAGSIYEKAKKREERPLSQRGYATLARVIRKMDKQQSHFVTGTKLTRRQKRELKYAAQEA